MLTGARKCACAQACFEDDQVAKITDLTRSPNFQDERHVQIEKNMLFCVYIKTSPPQNFQLPFNNDLYEIDLVMTYIFEVTTRAECFILKGMSGGCRCYVR